MQFEQGGLTLGGQGRHLQAARRGGPRSGPAPRRASCAQTHAAAAPADRRSSPKRGPRVSGALASGDRQRSAVAPQGQRTRSGTYAAKPDGGNSLGEKTEFAPFCSSCAFPAHVLHAPFGCFTLPLQRPRLGPVSESPGARGEQRVLGRGPDGLAGNALGRTQASVLSSASSGSRGRSYTHRRREYTAELPRSVRLTLRHLPTASRL